MTPEGRVKKAITAFLKTVPDLWYDMPVPSGYGKSTLDYLGCHRGTFFAIEAKAPGKKPTDRQLATMEMIQAAGGFTFVIHDADELEAFKLWIRANQLQE